MANVIRLGDKVIRLGDKVIRLGDSTSAGYSRSGSTNTKV
jgi:hypothetical protein